MRIFSIIRGSRSLVFRVIGREMISLRVWGGVCRIVRVGP